MTDNASQNNLTPIKVAYILDGEVVELLHTDERLSAIFLSNPIVLDVTKQFNDDPSSVRIGMSYDAATGTFSEPATIVGA
jgi:hypothetical protein